MYALPELKDYLLHQQTSPIMPHNHGESARSYSAKAREQPLAICDKKGEMMMLGGALWKGEI